MEEEEEQEQPGRLLQLLRLSRPLTSVSVSASRLLVLLLTPTVAEPELASSGTFAPDSEESNPPG